MSRGVYDPPDMDSDHRGRQIIKDGEAAAEREEKYPEHEKLRARRQESLTISEFLDFLDEQHLHLAKYHKHEEWERRLIDITRTRGIGPMVYSALQSFILSAIREATGEAARVEREACLEAIGNAYSRSAAVSTGDFLRGLSLAKKIIRERGLEGEAQK